MSDTARALVVFAVFYAGAIVVGWRIGGSARPFGQLMAMLLAYSFVGVAATVLAALI